MTKRTENGIVWDDDYWPKTGTLVNHIPTDLNDLWEEYGDQASIFVAEALIANPHIMRIDLTENPVSIVNYMWDVGGDCLVKYEDIISLIDRATTDYSEIKSDAQASDLEQRLKGLKNLDVAIEKARNTIDKQLQTWETSKVKS